MSSTEEENIIFSDDLEQNSCFIEGIPGSSNCKLQADASSEDGLYLGNNSSEADGSIDVTLTDAVAIDDPAFNLDTALGTVNIAFTFSKEDNRNKLVLLQSNEDPNIIVAPLGYDIELPENITGIIYEELSEVDPENYKFIKLYIPDAIRLFPRGTYVLRCYLNNPKIIANNIFDNWELISTQRITLKTSAIQGRIFNNKYLKTAFNRGTQGGARGVRLNLNDKENIIETVETTPVVTLEEDGSVINPTYNKEEN